jgi:hypothetical protein
MGKTPSTSNLLSTEMSTRLKSDVSHKALGSSSGGTATVGIVLPGLRELYEHSLAHTAALQRLMGQVEAADKGKPAPMLSRCACWAALHVCADHSVVWCTDVSCHMCGAIWVARSVAEVVQAHARCGLQVSAAHEAARGAARGAAHA